MRVLKGSRESGFSELYAGKFEGASLHRIAESAEGPGAGEVPVLLLDMGDEGLLQVRLTDDEAAILKVAFNNEGTWVYPE
ncbi:MAG: hypothetical protein ABFD98_19805 [Syntrophobacteraceae bacterium]|nr:hypothetical protein [Desulfobacteraceae bacterium]